MAWKTLQMKQTWERFGCLSYWCFGTWRSFIGLFVAAKTYNIPQSVVNQLHEIIQLTADQFAIVLNVDRQLERQLSVKNSSENKTREFQTLELNNKLF